MVKTIYGNMIVQENNIYNKNEIKIKSNAFVELMNIYSNANKEVEKQINNINRKYNLVDHIKARIKEPTSIIKKMKSKNYELTYQNLIEKVNDIAGIRIITSNVEDVYKIRNIIEEETNIAIIKEKDYIKIPKKSGYSSLHLVAEVPINIKEQIVFVKIEIQIRTIAMDLWANLEHDIKYKSNNEISKASSKKLIKYAKVLNEIEKEMVQMYKI